ncbi:MAG: hypothetical protein JSW52_10870 [Candidatus Coatesbacteria bacterium]|nr:MAG: hypothetical protein JSW52_10870 [Candidatus Coatesbacteria bacterium]
MIYDATDYVKETKELVKSLIETEFAGAIVHMSDPDNVPAYGGGTFCVEGAASGADTSHGAFGQVYVTIRVWTYYTEVDNELAEARVSELAQKLEAVLLAATSGGPAAGNDIVGTDFIQTAYLTREKGRALRRKYLRAARTEWRVRLAACR